MGVKAKDPYLPLFVGDFLAATATWSGPERGLYLQMLAVQWSSGPLPCDHARLAQALHYTLEDFEQLWLTVAPKFANGDGHLRNLRLEEVRKKSASITAKRQHSAGLGVDRRRDMGEQIESKREAKPPAKGEPVALPLHDVLRNHPIQSNPIQEEDSQGSSLSPPATTLVGAQSPTGPPQARGARIPQPFEVTDAMRAWAAGEAPGADLAALTREFCDYWVAVPGARGRKLDWEATWRNSVRERHAKITRSKTTRATRFDELTEHLK